MLQAQNSNKEKSQLFHKLDRRKKTQIINCVLDLCTHLRPGDQTNLGEGREWGIYRLYLSDVVSYESAWSSQWEPQATPDGLSVPECGEHKKV